MKFVLIAISSVTLDIISLRSHRLNIAERLASCGSVSLSLIMADLERGRLQDGVASNKRRKKKKNEERPNSGGKI